MRFALPARSACRSIDRLSRRSCAITSSAMWLSRFFVGPPGRADEVCAALARFRLTFFMPSPGAIGKAAGLRDLRFRTGSPKLDFSQATPWQRQRHHRAGRRCRRRLTQAKLRICSALRRIPRPVCPLVARLAPHRFTFSNNASAVAQMIAAPIIIPSPL